MLSASLNKTFPSFLLTFAKKDYFFGVPSHIGIGGNEKADSAKSALDLSCVKVGVPCTDFKHCINQNILSTWKAD